MTKKLVEDLTSPRSFNSLFEYVDLTLALSTPHPITMMSQRILARAAQRFSQQSRSPATRSATRRKYASEASGDPGAAKNPLLNKDVGGFRGVQDNPFTRERAAVKKHAAETSDLWRKLSIYVVIPALCLASANAYRLWTEHWEHKAHEPPRSEQPEYSYQNIRTKNFPWGDGDKTLFWNDKVNYHKKNKYD